MFLEKNWSVGIILPDYDQRVIEDLLHDKKMECDFHISATGASTRFLEFLADVSKEFELGIWPQHMHDEEPAAVYCAQCSLGACRLPQKDPSKSNHLCVRALRTVNSEQKPL